MTLAFHIEDLVTANRILASQGIVDSFGHVSIRHPDNPGRYFLSRGRAPERVETGDIMEFTLEGEPIDAKGRKPYLERFIHGAVYEKRPDVMACVHNHSPGVIPFGITGRKMRPVMHMCATIGHEVPIWDQYTKFGDSNLLVESMEVGRDLAEALGDGRTALMRGHGAVVCGPTLRATIYTSVYLELNAKLQMQAESMQAESGGEPVRFLTPGETKMVSDTTSVSNINRAWENWCKKAERPYKE